jgi:hypothetical protein
MMGPAYVVHGKGYCGDAQTLSEAEEILGRDRLGGGVIYARLDIATADATRARIVWLERIEKAALRVATAWPYYRELTDYVEFEDACAAVRETFGLKPGLEDGES